jgi:hypothetical protein
MKGNNLKNPITQQEGNDLKTSLKSMAEKQHEMME